MRGARCSLRLLIWFFGWGLARAQEPATAVGGLPEDLLPGLGPILETALAQSPDTIRSSIAVMNAEGGLLVARSVRLPNLGGYARYAVNHEATIGGSGVSSTNSGLYFDFGLSQPVYAFGALRARHDVGRIELKIAERQHEEAYRLLVLALRDQYLRLVAQKSALGAMRAQLKVDEDSLVRERARLEDRLISATTVAVAEEGLKRRQFEIDKEAEEFDFARRRFARLAGLTHLSDDAIPSELVRPTTVADAGRSLLQRFVAGGVEQTYQGQVFAMEVEREARNYVIASKRLYPKFALFAGYNQRSETQADVGRINQVAVTSRYYGIRLDWSVFDGLATRGEKISVLARKRANERRLKSYVDETADIARHQWTKVGLAARGLELAESTLGTARAVLKLVEGEFAARRALQADVDRAQQAVRQAEANILPVRADYLMTWATFVSLVGADPAMQKLPARYVR